MSTGAGPLYLMWSVHCIGMSTGAGPLYLMWSVHCIGMSTGTGPLYLMWSVHCIGMSTGAGPLYLMWSVHCSDVSRPSFVATGIPLHLHFIMLFLLKSYVLFWLFVQDARWNDVNVVSSLLKLFFRRLPDSLLTSELYPHFIEADKIEDPAKRVVAIKKLVRKHRIHDLLMPCCFLRYTYWNKNYTR